MSNPLVEGSYALVVAQSITRDVSVSREAVQGIADYIVAFGHHLDGLLEESLAEKRRDEALLSSLVAD